LRRARKSNSEGQNPGSQRSRRSNPNIWTDKEGFVQIKTDLWVLNGILVNLAIKMDLL